ncbi:MAG: putative toxin-antitoxin system toxin component, PIN family [Candidatus Kerfeldbacteria bacterium]|nr:putative toxin-antitoxin system toxin component, PIN family [Candidatus Kerfeldbacteria bacterium]
MTRVVLDTNVLINADRGEYSYPKRILDLILNGSVMAVMTKPVRRENQLLVERLVRDTRLKDDIMDFLIMAELAQPAVIKVKIDDAEDIKLLAAAVGGKAEWLITEDRHLLDLEKYQAVEIVTPQAWWQWWQAQDNQTANTWQSWTKNLFKT